MKRYLDPKADLAFKKIFGDIYQELLDNPETSKALETVEESALTKAERLAYDDFWEKLGAERLLFIDSNKISREEGRAEGMAKGLEQGRAEGREKGREEGRAEGRATERTATARRLMEMGLSTEQIAQGSGLTADEVRKLKKETE